MNQVILKPYSVMRIINIVMVLKLTIHRYIRNGSIKKLIRKGLRRWNYSTGKKTVFDIHTKFAVGKELAGKRMVRANALLLSVAAQFNDPTAVEIMNG